jgi:uncharacterized delta-60 repeat protein
MLVAALAGLFAFTSSAVAKPQPGDLDHSFAKNGVARTSIPPGPSLAEAVAIGHKGRIVVAGSNTKGFALARYRPNGKLDRSFSHDGTVSTGFGGEYVLGYDVALVHRAQASARPKNWIVVAGKVCPTPDRCEFAVARYNPDGTLDKSFGDGGKARVAFPGKAYNVATAMAIDSRKGVLLAGRACAGVGSGCDFALARLDRRGELDPDFGNDGRVITQFTTGGGSPVSSGASDITIDYAPSRVGVIVVGGSAEGIGLASYEPDGRLVKSFGHDGKVKRTLPRFRGDVAAIAVDPKNKIVVAGSGYSLARFGENGGLDRSFGKGGQVSTVVSKAHSKLFDVAMDSRNRIVAAGSPHFTLVRYQPNGNLNKAFGRKGIARENFGSGWAYGLAIDSHERPVAAGFTRDRPSSARFFAVARFLG